MMRAPLVACLVLVAGCAAPRVRSTPDGDTVRITVDGEPFAVVHVAAEPRPFVWPLLAPGGVPVTRDFPMAERDGEQHDHPHHQSLWFTHGDVDGFDFWHGTEHRERIALVDRQLTSGDSATVLAEYRWLVGDDQVVATEARSLTFGERDGVRMIDVVTELRPAQQTLTFGDTKEGTFAVRVHPELRADGPVASGTLRNSEGRVGGEVWGKRARWIDDSGQVDGHAVGITMFDHPSNLRHPTWWHARSYGLLAANPFGVHDFEKKAPGTGRLVLQEGETLTLRYRVLLHGDGWDDARIEDAYAEWITAGTDPQGQ